MEMTEDQKYADLVKRLDAIGNQLRDIRSLVGPFGTLMPDGSMLVQTLWGLKYFIDPLDEIMAPQLIVYRQWEPELSGFIAHSLTPDSIFVDVGANFGYFTCLAATRIGQSGKGRVFAVEPNPSMQVLLRKNVKVNWSIAPVEIHECAASEVPGYAELIIPTDGAANATIASRSIKIGEKRAIVKARPLDEILGDTAINIMKVDVEGFEAAVLRGARNAIAKSQDIHIILEWSMDQTRAAGFTADDLLAIFRECNLSAHQLPASQSISDAQWKALEIPPADLCNTGYANILLRHRRD